MIKSRYFENPIFVTGLPRSGTSMVAGCLHQCGAWVGNTVAGGVGNEKGFFENIALREQLVKRLLTTMGCDPLGVKSLPQYDMVPSVNGLLEGFKTLSTERWLSRSATLAIQRR